jgi:pSer/pThr/pTyr-binding forkhead associated (FHA) protein
MKKAPDIQVQLIHIDGPLKGEIQEFYKNVISIGRHPDCDVVFPRDDTGISRKHAVLTREGNRYKLEDSSANGTMVNGKPVKEVYLKNGDVLIFGDGGPKVSFLSAMAEAREISVNSVDAVTIPKLVSVASQSAPLSVPEKADKKQDFFKEKSAAPIGVPVQEGKKETDIATVQKSLVIQFGATLKAFKKLPVTVGSGADCDFVITGRGLLEHHLQVFYRQEKYWVKDLTGRSIVTINMQPLMEESVLPPDTCLALTPKGPHFQFLGEGRLAEISEENDEQSKGIAGSGGKGGGIVSHAELQKKNKKLWLIPLVIVMLLTVFAGIYFLVQIVGPQISQENGANNFFVALQEKIRIFFGSQ